MPPYTEHVRSPSYYETGNWQLSGEHSGATVPRISALLCASAFLERCFGLVDAPVFPLPAVSRSVPLADVEGIHLDPHPRAVGHRCIEGPGLAQRTAQLSTRAERAADEDTLGNAPLGGVVLGGHPHPHW